VGTEDYLTIDRLHRVITVGVGARPPHFERGKGQREGSGSRCRKANVQGNPGVRAQCADQIFLVGVFPLSFLYLFLLFLSSRYFKSKRKTIDFGVVTLQSNPPENGTVKSVCQPPALCTQCIRTVLCTALHRQ